MFLAIDGIERLVDRDAAAVENSTKGPVHQHGALLKSLFEFLAIHRGVIVPHYWPKRLSIRGTAVSGRSSSTEAPPGVR